MFSAAMIIALHGLDGSHVTLTCQDSSVFPSWGHATTHGTATCPRISSDSWSNVLRLSCTWPR